MPAASTAMQPSRPFRVSLTLDAFGIVACLTASRLPSFRGFPLLLRTEVSCDFRTFILSFLIGCVLSFPVGFVLALTIRPFEPPAWTEPIYFGVVITSFILLPIWSHFVLRRQPILRRLGLTTFQLGLFILILGSLFR